MSVGNVSFKGVAQEVINPRSWAKQFTREKELKAELLAQMPNSIKLLDKMKTFVGEVPNIIINAIGTGLVAPIFIKYNPLSKADDDTRTYSALRQPVSAVLAVITQAGLVIPFNNLIDNQTNKGKFAFKPEQYNKTAYQDVSYLKKQIKKENPNLSKAEIEKLAKNKQYNQLEDMIEQLYNKNTIEYSVKGKNISLSADEVKNLMTSTTDSMLKSAKEGSEEQAILKEMQEAIKNNKTVKEVWNISKKIPESNFVYDVAQKHISNMSANIKGMKQITGLVVSLAILPVTCCLLNYVYPKIMKALFPHLSEKKQEKSNPQDTFSKAVDNAVQPRYKVEKEGV